MTFGNELVSSNDDVREAAVGSLDDLVYKLISEVGGLKSVINSMKENNQKRDSKLEKEIEGNRRRDSKLDNEIQEGWKRNSKLDKEIEEGWKRDLKLEKEIEGNRKLQQEFNDQAKQIVKLTGEVGKGILD